MLLTIVNILARIAISDLIWFVLTIRYLSKSFHSINVSKLLVIAWTTLKILRVLVDTLTIIIAGFALITTLIVTNKLTTQSVTIWIKLNSKSRHYIESTPTDLYIGIIKIRVIEKWLEQTKSIKLSKVISERIKTISQELLWIESQNIFPRGHIFLQLKKSLEVKTLYQWFLSLSYKWTSGTSRKKIVKADPSYFLDK